jgi:hypothetical protein
MSSDLNLVVRKASGSIPSGLPRRYLRAWKKSPDLQAF